jgi:hypothetical protein
VAHVDADDLPDRERVFIARTLRQAKRVEALLTESGVHYAVAVEPYGRSFLFGTIRHGAAFYVAGAQARHCRELLIGTGFEKGVIERESEDRD